MIPWFPGGHADPWNHVEAAMALTTGGRRAEAERAYAWLARASGPTAPGTSTTGTAGWRSTSSTPTSPPTWPPAIWHHFLATDDTGFLEAMWPVVEAAVGFVLDLQTERGEVIWARHADGTPWSFALLTASSSTYASLRCASAIAARLGHGRAAWVHAADRLGHTIAHHPGAFLPKDRWSMDWYYPVLTGVLTGPAATARLAAGYQRFVMEGLGVRCVADKDWVTAAETAECAMAYLAAGDHDTRHAAARLGRAPAP